MKTSSPVPRSLHLAEIALALGLSMAIPTAVRADVHVNVFGHVFVGQVGIPDNAPFDVTFTIRPGMMSDDLNATANIGEYVDETQGFIASFDDGALEVDCMGTRLFVNDNVSGPVPLPANHDRLTFRGIDCMDTFGNTLSDSFGVNVRIGDSTAQAITGDDLSDDVVLDLIAAGNIGQVNLGCTSGATCNPTWGLAVVVEGATAQQVPEPGLTLGLMTGLTGLSLATRRRVGRVRDPSVD